MSSFWKWKIKINKFQKGLSRICLKTFHNTLWNWTCIWHLKESFGAGLPTLRYRHLSDYVYEMVSMFLCAGSSTSVCIVVQIHWIKKDLIVSFPCLFFEKRKCNGKFCCGFFWNIKKLSMRSKSKIKM